jgi:hypothetical protein
MWKVLIGNSCFENSRGCYQQRTRPASRILQSHANLKMAMLERGADLPFWPNISQLSSSSQTKTSTDRPIVDSPTHQNPILPSHSFFPFPLTIYHPTMARSPLLTRLCALIASLLFLLSAQAAAQSTTTTSAPAATGSVTASIYPGTSTWAYVGCYNETDSINGTGGLRALNGGPDEVLTNMTVGECLSFCSGNAYAGLEYSR